MEIEMCLEKERREMCLEGDLEKERELAGWGASWMDALSLDALGKSRWPWERAVESR